MNQGVNIVFSIAMRYWVTDEIQGELHLALQLLSPKMDLYYKDRGTQVNMTLHMSMQTFKK